MILGIYIGVSLCIGLALTLIAWENDSKARALETVISFIGMIGCFALVWPLMAAALLTGK